MPGYDDNVHSNIALITILHQVFGIPILGHLDLFDTQILALSISALMCVYFSTFFCIMVPASVYLNFYPAIKKVHEMLFLQMKFTDQL